VIPELARAAVRGGRLLLRWLASPREPGRFTAPAVPRVSLEVTNVCNSRCGFCANRVMRRPRMAMPMSLFIQAVDELAAMGVSEIDFNCTVGEPLLDPHLLERARSVRRYPQFEGLGFVTTLQWLHRFDLEAFFEAGFTWLGVSTTLSGRETYRAFFGVDAYERMLDNLERLIVANGRRARPMWIGIGLKPTGESARTIMRHPDYQRIRRVYGASLDRAVRERNLFVDDWGGAVQLPRGLRKRPLIPRRKRPCRLLYSGLAVFSNGVVGACACRDFEANSELVLGQVGRDRLSQLWGGEKLYRLRADWRERNVVPAICRRCRHYLP